MISLEEAEKWLREHKGQITYWDYIDLDGSGFFVATGYVDGQEVRGSGDNLLEAVEKAMEGENDVRRS